jgi:putative DNA primase/helicase
VEDALIKALVAGDTMSVRQVYKEPFELHPTAKLWWAMNELPAVADTSEGFWRRVRVVPFNRSFGKQTRIPDLKERLERELPGIFVWAMEGLRRLRARGHFEEPRQVLEKTAQYRKKSNPIRLFIEDECTTGKNLQAQSSEIYQAYREYCYDHGYKPKSDQRFKDEMERLEFWHKKGRLHNVYLGIDIQTV